MRKSDWTLEALIGLAGILIAVAALVFFFSARWAWEPMILEDVVQTRAADLLTHIPTQTPWVVTVTPSPTPTIQFHQGPR